MKMFNELTEVYLHREPVDFRKSINGLMVIVEQDMQLSPFTGTLFVFSNKAHNKLKVLYWDKTGFALWYKRLEKNRFKWPHKVKEATMTLSEQQFNWLLDGFDVIGHEPLLYRASGL